MRILYLNPPGDIHRNIGGIETYAREIAAAMAQRGHSVHALDLEPKAVLARSGLRELLPKPAYRQRYYLWRTGYVDNFRYHQTLARITSKAIADFRPDLVHSFHSYHYGAIRDRSLPTVVSCHGLEIEDIPPVRGSLEHATGIHCNSRFTLSRVRGILDPGERVRVLGWGIRAGSMPEPGPARYDLVTVGRLVRRKNIDTVLEALKDRPGLRYAIAGAGPEGPALRRQAERIGLPNVDFLGPISEQHKSGLLASSRLFVMCPRHDGASDVEGLGLVYFEAQAAGLPAIGSNAGGVPEAIGDAGLLVNNPLDPLEIGAAIDRALEAETHSRLSLVVQERQREHAWDGFIDGWEAWYRELAGT